jgi:cell division topological specificity factor
MSFLSFLLGEKKKTASVAKERLQIILAHERSGRNAAEPDYLPALQRELVAVISKYVKINPDDIKVQPGAPGQPGSAGSEDRAARSPDRRRSGSSTCRTRGGWP